MKNKLIILITFMLFALLLIGCAADDNSDKYDNFEELSKHEIENKDYVIDSLDVNAETTIISIHGGNIEPGTSELTKEIAKNKYNFYSFDGIKNKDNFDLHIKSTHFDEPICVDLVENNESTLSLHGFKSDKNITYVGGLDTELVEKIKSELEKAGFIAVKASESFSGKEKDNIVNRNKNGKGVQLEISTAQRKAFFAGDDFNSRNRENTTDDFYKYAEAINDALNSARKSEKGLML